MAVPEFSNEQSDTGSSDGDWVPHDVLLNHTDPRASPAPAPGFPIAIIGMSCKFAGDAKNPEELWELCARGRSAWSEIPKSRFNHDAFYDADNGKLGMVSENHVESVPE